ncbi:hypothetical protein [Methanoculleus sp.]|uniref:hypothetical protein n=1 Tax=Methanoculleus sp. TaxID=90427 RepID=UPI0025CEE1FD|nr:hypothetical protein [Methanoculleus sp.]
MPDEKAWAMITVFVLGVVAALEFIGRAPVEVILIVGLFAIVLLLGIGVLVLCDIRDGIRDAR